MDAEAFLAALGATLAKHDQERPQRGDANAASWMLFMQRVLVEVAANAGLHAHVGDVFDLAFSPKERSAWAAPAVTIAHDNEWTDAEVTARLYEMRVSFAPLRVAFVYPDMPPDECVKRVLESGAGWDVPATSEDIVLIGDPRGVHFRWPEWRVLRRERGGALKDIGTRALTGAPACSCAAAREAATTRDLEGAVASRLLAGCNHVSSHDVPGHHHYDEVRIQDSRYRCRTCGSHWIERRFDDRVAHVRPDPNEALCRCRALEHSVSFRMNRRVSDVGDGKDIIAGCEELSREGNAVHLRCRTCKKAWTHRRIDYGGGVVSGHVEDG